MSCKFPNLRPLAAIALLGIAAPQVAGQGTDRGLTEGASATAIVIDESVDKSGNSVDKSGNELVARAVTALAQYHSISATVRQRIYLFDQHLVGVGSYQQLTVGPDRLLRLELKMPIGNQMTLFQQICDGRFLWSQHVEPSASDSTTLQTVLTRVDLDAVRTMVPDRAATNGGIGGPGPWMTFGGLVALLQQLEHSFQFLPPATAQLQNVPVWVARGQWSSASRQQLLQRFPPRKKEGHPDPEPALPQHIPARVQLVFGQDDLFPYRIQFLGNPPAETRPSDTARELPSVTFEFFEVQLGGEIDPAVFVFNPGKSPVVDATQDYLSRSK